MDTWTWGQNGWAVAAVQGPSPRYGALATYDPVRRNVLLYGGTSGQSLAMSSTDTWVWNGASWVRQAPSHSPPYVWPGAGKLTFDAARGEAILFGNTVVGPVPTTFTWAWTGSDWVEKHAATSPPFRYEAAMAYDGASKDVILFGGYQQEFEAGFIGDTWIWNGVGWTQAASSSLSPPAGPAYAAFDEIANKTWLLTFDGTMWSWSGSRWSRQGTHPSVAGRWHASMLFDGQLGKIVLFGGGTSSPSGNAVMNDLWAWNGSAWSRIL